MGGAEQAGAGGGAAKDTGPRTGATGRDDTAAMPTVVGRSDQLASAVDRFTGCLPFPHCKALGDKEMEFATRVNNPATSRKVAGYAAGASVGSMSKRVFMSRRKMP